jgi:hypothetical protein
MERTAHELKAPEFKPGSKPHAQVISAPALLTDADRQPASPKTHARSASSAVPIVEMSIVIMAIVGGHCHADVEQKRSTHSFHFEPTVSE